MKNLLVASKVRCIVPGVLARDLCRHTDWCNNDSGETRQGTFKCGYFVLLIAEEVSRGHILGISNTGGQLLTTVMCGR